MTGRWVLVIKRDDKGLFQKAKARWVLRGFQDREKDTLQLDNPTSTRLAFRLTCQHAANRHWDMVHADMKTAFLQGEEYTGKRDVVAQLPVRKDPRGS